MALRSSSEEAASYQGSSSEPGRIRILLVDDDEDDYQITRNLLEKAQWGKFDLVWVSTYSAALSRLKAVNFDAALIDFDLGFRSGLELLEEAGIRTKKVPFILLTGRGHQDTHIQAMRLGAFGYLSKSELSSGLLERTILFAIERKRAERELHRLNEELERRVRERTEELQRANNLLEKFFDSIHLNLAYLDRNLNYIKVNKSFARTTGQEVQFFEGKNHLDLYPDPALEQIYHKVIETGEPYFAFGAPLPKPADPKAGLAFWDWSLQPVKDYDGNVGGLVLSLLEVTARVQAELQLRQHHSQIEAQAGLSHLLAEMGPDFEKVLDAVVRRVTELVGDNCSLTLLSEDGQVLKPVAAFHPDPEALRMLDELNRSTIYRLGEGTAGKVALTGQPLLIPSIDPESLRVQVNPTYLPYLDRFGVYGLLIVPLKIRNQVLGTLGIARNLPGRPYTLEDQAFLQDLANRAALAIANGMLFQRLQKELSEHRQTK